MVSNFHMPPTGYGPGSQPLDEDDKALEYLPMPQDMRAYSTHIPEVEAVVELAPALALLAQMSAACARVAQGAANETLDLSNLDTANRALISETLGQGEVSVKMHGIPAIAAQESVFAGVWSLLGAGVDTVEIGPVPQMAIDRAFEARKPALGALAPKPAGVVNAPPLLVELMDKSAAYSPEAELHVINLSLLPHTEPDLEWLDDALGKGSVDILSRGYGNCRISATGQAHVWRVQFFNSMDTLILDTFEVTRLPEVALAAPEDLSDSAERICEVLEAIR
ncbi:hydrogenase expression/formation protein [Thalassovita sp.]|uniref:hydrogenase expression/formation protein n=1 Tax=Thalassovita sp. TaxID=1979401 RepID=UPI0028823411|nr:hydrogenase expression/formation protein [Thalassovita sp.]MDF1803407.1 hydrogenase expression/formation protein [Thalassovita sp.]